MKTKDVELADKISISTTCRDTTRRDSRYLTKFKTRVANILNITLKLSLTTK